MAGSNSIIKCIHKGIVLKQFGGVLEVFKNEEGTVLEKEKNGQYVVAIEGKRCYLHDSFLDASFIPKEDRFAYFETNSI